MQGKLWEQTLDETVANLKQTYGQTYCKHCVTRDECSKLCPVLIDKLKKEADKLLKRQTMQEQMRRKKRKQ